jgi:hypothetical protein
MLSCVKEEQECSHFSAVTPCDAMYNWLSKMTEKHVQTETKKKNIHDDTINFHFGYNTVYVSTLPTCWHVWNQK